jgi:hypothetical protein
MKLRVLAPEGRRLVTEELVAGTRERWAEDAWRPYVAEHARVIPLEALDAHLERVMREHAAHDPALDAALAPLLHRSLGLARREAAEPGLWRYLAVVHAPQLVGHRWEYLSWASASARFWSVGTRHTSNAFGRLWWIAELTRDGASYDLTTRALNKPSLATQVFARSWSQHRPAVHAFLDVLETAPAETIERTARGLSRHLAIVPLERLEYADLERVVRALSREA